MLKEISNLQLLFEENFFVKVLLIFENVCKRSLFLINFSVEICKGTSTLQVAWPNWSESVIIRIVKKFETPGCVNDDKAGKVGAKQTAWSEENIDQERKLMHATLQTSITRVGQEIGISVVSAHWILTADITLFPYKIQVHQSLSQVTVGKCLNFAIEFGTYLDAHPLVLPLIWFSDEGNF